MFPQTYGTRYYGKRFPIKTKKQIVAESKSFAFMEYARVFMVYLSSITNGIATFLSKQIGKRLLGKANGVTTFKKVVSLGFIAICNIGSSIAKHIIPSSIVAVSKVAVAMKKHIRKASVAIANGLASMLRYRQFEFEFIGPFAPGDIVKINSKTMEVTLNDENVLHLIKKADFPVIHKGEQKLIYKDKEGNRTVKITVKWRDKWL